MDYGQSKTNPSGQSVNDFGVPSDGPINQEAGIFNPENNLDLSSEGAASWDLSPNRDTRRIGSEAIISSSEIPSNDYKLEAPATINPEMPPGYPEIVTSQEPESGHKDQNQPMVLDFSTIREKNNFISKDTLDTTEKAVHKYEKDEISPAELSDLRWEGVNAYLKNSFGRELGDAA